MLPSEYDEDKQYPLLLVSRIIKHLVFCACESIMNANYLS